MEDWKQRTRMLIGDEGIDKLEKSRIFILGLGGVGSFAAEFLARAGVGSLILVDGDAVSDTNRNRQILATTETTGRDKTEVMKERLLKINPEIRVTAHRLYVSEQKIEEAEKIISEKQPDFAADAIDTVGPKAAFIELCLRLKIPLISSLGAGGKTDPSLIRTAPFEEAYNCRLAAALRKRLRKKNIESGFHAVFSPEPVDRSKLLHVRSDGKASVSGTVSYMPAAFGVHMSSFIIKKIIL